jgi:hypothetical protein
MEKLHMKNTRKWQISILVLVIISVAIYFGYKEPKVEFDTSAFKLKGLYGVNLPFAEIVEADTIVWNEMPAIAMRSNGISLNKVQRGKFITTKDEKIHLNIYSGISPLIRIVMQDGSVYYINRKNAEETRQIFNNLKNKVIK